MSDADELAKLADLKQQGLLSDAEFEAEKAKVIGPSNASAAAETPPPPATTAPVVAAAGAPLPPTAPAPPPSTDGDDVQPEMEAGFRITAKELVIALIVLLLIGGSVAAGLLLSGGSNSGTSGTSANPDEVFLQPTNSTGANPFTPNVGTDAVVSRSVSSSLPAGSGGVPSYSGNTVGLYGGTLNTRSCNPQQLISYLTATPAKARAWAAAEGIPVSQIPAYINSLTPMILRYDTRVTNHGFLNGVANPIPEILQAGQAVLVDNHGVPRARCYCGNPLTPPTPVAHPVYTGQRWTGFSPTTVVTLIDNDTGQPFNRPSGTTGTADGPAEPGSAPTMPGLTVPTTTTPTTTPPVTTTPATIPVTAPNGQALGTGAVQVTLTWSTVADLDLRILEPDGTQIDFGSRSSSDGGTLDVDSNGGCSNLTSSPVENVFWANPPPAGAYTARVTYYEDCGASGSGPQNFTLTIKVNGQVVQQHSGTLAASGDSQEFPYTVG
jgi:hypothetical protein